LRPPDGDERRGVHAHEPYDRAVVKLVRSHRLGRLREFISASARKTDATPAWRLNRSLAGGGPLVDAGVHFINAARFLSGEEPAQVCAQFYRPAHDCRFREVEAAVQFLLQFPSGFTASCSCSYAAHPSRFFRLHGSDGWAELNPARAGGEPCLRYWRLLEGRDIVSEVALSDRNPFAEEIDHLAECIRTHQQPRTAGEEGLRDQRIVDAIYCASQNGQMVRLDPPVPAEPPAPG
jgi:predicted dehydrogenase